MQEIAVALKRKEDELKSRESKITEKENSLRDREHQVSEKEALLNEVIKNTNDIHSEC